MSEEATDFYLTTSRMTTQSLYALASNMLTSNASFMNNKSRYLLSGSTGEDYIGYSDNITGLLNGPEGYPQLRYWAFILLLFPLLTIFGNILVVLSVLKEKSLQTCTNYFVVSLALSDLIVASCVMPFAVYYEVTQHWYMSNFLCDAWVSTDVMGSTASILNLVSIAIDRYIAVQYPLKYAQHKNSNRIYLTIAFVWILSIFIALPMLAGMNDAKDRVPNQCAFNNDTFLLYSSVFSFYVPTILMIILYYKIFTKIRTRAKNSKAHKFIPVKDSNKKSIQKNNNNNNNNPIAQANNNEQALVPLVDQATKNTPNLNTSNTAPQVEVEKLIEQSKQQRVGETEKKPLSKKLSPVLSARQLKATIGKSVSKMNNHASHNHSASSKKEKKITKTLAIVLIVYLVCWSPFFAINNLSVGICHIMNFECKWITNELVSFLTWLGYLNSLLNPIIYTTFNIEFRRAFAKILSEVCRR